LAVTGNLSFGSRDEFKEYVEGLGGKVVSAVSKNTDYLVNNDSSSLSSKNVKARELGVKVITEEDFLNIVNEMTKE
ncbi:MAG: NAD-dependent DNA ligase LigA, partial [Clostridiales bacterium]|nr:NAD-dependent DNA ligase LigA [Clostridiales bacterium]